MIFNARLVIIFCIKQNYYSLFQRIKPFRKTKVATSSNKKSEIWSFFVVEHFQEEKTFELPADQRIRLRRLFCVTIWLLQCRHNNVVTFIIFFFNLQDLFEAQILQQRTRYKKNFLIINLEVKKVFEVCSYVLVKGVKLMRVICHSSTDL